MLGRHRRRLGPALIAGAVFAATSGVLAQPAGAAGITSVTRVNLPRTSTASSWAVGVSNSGAVLGYGTYSCAIIEGLELVTTCSHALRWPSNTSQPVALAGTGSIWGQTTPYAIGPSGTVLGYATVNNVTRYVLWKSNSPTLLPAGLTAVAINASDQVAETTSSTGTPVAGIWTNGVLSATVSGADAVALNNQGHLLVDTYPNSTQNLSTRTELVRNGSSITLPLLPGCSTSTGVAVNSADQAIGTCLSTASDGTAVTHGVVWTVAANGTATATDVGSLGGAYVDPLAIDAAGDVMGNASNSIATPHSHAFLWNAGHLTDLGSLGGTDTWATAMNASGEIVGESTTSYDTSNAHAFVWAAGTMTDLTPTANTASTAGGINDTGEVVESTVPTRPGSAAGNFAAGTYVSVLWQLH